MFELWVRKIIRSWQLALFSAMTIITGIFQLYVFRHTESAIYAGYRIFIGPCGICADEAETVNTGEDEKEVNSDVGSDSKTVDNKKDKKGITDIIASDAENVDSGKDEKGITSDVGNGLETGDSEEDAKEITSDIDSDESNVVPQSGIEVQALSSGIIELQVVPTKQLT